MVVVRLPKLVVIINEHVVSVDKWAMCVVAFQIPHCSRVKQISCSVTRDVTNFSKVFCLFQTASCAEAVDVEVDVEVYRVMLLQEGTSLSKSNICSC